MWRGNPMLFVAARFVRRSLDAGGRLLPRQSLRLLRPLRPAERGKLLATGEGIEWMKIGSSLNFSRVLFKISTVLKRR